MEAADRRRPLLEVVTGTHARFRVRPANSDEDPPSDAELTKAPLATCTLMPPRLLGSGSRPRGGVVERGSKAKAREDMLDGDWEMEKAARRAESAACAPHALRLRRELLDAPPALLLQAPRLLPGPSSFASLVVLLPFQLTDEETHAARNQPQRGTAAANAIGAREASCRACANPRRQAREGWRGRLRKLA